MAAPSLRLGRHPDRTRFVLGFAYNSSGSRVLLINQLRGIATGSLNGIGGRVRPRETYAQAMHRHFAKQAGVIVASGWTPFAILEADERRVQVYRADLNEQLWHAAHTEGDEALHRCSVASLPERAWPDLMFLVPLGLNVLPTAVVRVEYRPL